MAAKRSRKVKPRQNLAEKLAAQILTGSQSASGEYVIRDVANHSDADQRHMTRSGQTKTMMRKTRVERLLAARVIDQHHAKALQWYADQHEAGFATVGITANYCGTGGGGFAAADLLSRNKEQAEARANYAWARDFIPAELRERFERVVIGQGDLNEFPAIGASERTRFRNRRAAFQMACNFLHDGIGHVTG